MDQVNLQQHGQQKMRQTPAAPRRYDGQGGNPMYDPNQGGHYGASLPTSSSSFSSTSAPTLSHLFLNPY